MRRLAGAVLSDVRRAFVRLVLGVKCDVCCEFLRGPRTLYAHAEREHPGETA